MFKVNKSKLKQYKIEAATELLESRIGNLLKANPELTLLDAFFLAGRLTPQIERHLKYAVLPLGNDKLITQANARYEHLEMYLAEIRKLDKGNPKKSARSCWR